MRNSKNLWKDKFFLCITALLLFCHASIVAQESLLITGRVTGSTDNEPLSGVSVTVKGENTGTFTDGNGNFRINAARGRTLVFSFLGFETQEIAVQNNTINVSLNTTSSELETVVVVGYNTVKKSDLTGAVATVSSEQMIRMPVSNPLQALQGITPGVDITSNERPGEVGSVRIRGERSISAGNNPLYVVDGIPLSTGGIEFINPSDIESVNVLKDASATAIYGSRGANGVILITTKNGRAGGVNLNYNGRVTVESMHDRVQMMNSAQYIEFRRDAYRRLTTANRYPDVPTEAADQAIFGTDPYAWANVQKGWVNGVWDGSRVPTTDWTDFVLQTGVTQDHYLSASGGTDKIKSYGSFGYLDQEGTQLGQDYRRFSSKYSADIKATKWFSMGGSLNATYGIQNYGYATTNATGPGNLYFAAQGMLPFAVPYDENGQRIMLPGGDINILNPIDEDKYNINERKVLRAFGSFFAEAQITEGLKLRVNFGPEFYNNRNGRWMDENSINRGAGNVGSTNYAQLNQTNRFAWTLDNLLYYDRTIDKHNFGLTLLQSTTSNKTETSTMTATDLPWNSQKWNQLNSVSELDGFGTNLIETQLLSYMGRVNYSFNDKYLLTASARWDGASQLAEGNKWDFFPSAAVAWRLDQEDFIKNQTWINQLKLRLGYGITGNAAIDPYATKGAIETLYYTWGNLVEAGYVSSDASLANPISMANLGLGWEKTKQYNLGFDFGFWNDRLNGSIDLYSSTTDDILLRMAIPSVTGFTSTWGNIGRTKNKGIDLQLNSLNVSTNDFRWRTSLNFTANKDEIDILSQGRNDDVNNLWFIGQRLRVYYDYEKAGIWQDTPEDLAEIAKYAGNGQTFRPGDIKVVDQNGDYKIDANNDRVIRGSSSPKWNTGFTNSFTYKNWDLNVFIYARWGFMIAAGQESLQGRFAQRLVDYWTPSNPTNEYPSPNWGNAIGDPFRSSMNYQDGSFIKLRNVSLGYTVPQQMANRLSMKNLKIFAQAMNLGLLYSKVDWIDPDLGGSTFNRGFVLGVNVGF